MTQEDSITYNPGSKLTSDERNFAGLSHIGTIAGYLFGLGHIIVPLVIWLTKKDTSPFVAQHARESLNFQISMTLWFIACGILTIVLIGILGFIVLGIVDLVCIILATMKAYNGEKYEYPLSIRFVR